MVSSGRTSLMVFPRERGKNGCDQEERSAVVVYPDCKDRAKDNGVIYHMRRVVSCVTTAGGALPEAVAAFTFKTCIAERF